MTLIVMAGLPGTGKTTLAQALIKTMSPNGDRAATAADQIPPVILNKDTVRAALFPSDLIEYSREQDDFCMDIMLRVARYLFQKNPDRTLILDGRTFTHRDQVQTVEEAAGDMGVALYWIECICDPETAKGRLLTDMGLHPAVNRNPDLYEKVAADAEPLTVARLTVDTTQPLQTCVQDTLRYLSQPYRA
ncbi:MAG: ATP-binding protein [Anaerolineales bacterium]|nr:MAG: ATP-binding protein [Anaerolineales bacterium]